MKGTVLQMRVIGGMPITLILPPGHTAGAEELRVLYQLLQDDGA